MKYWVFDLDGTLVDSLTILFQNFDQVFSAYGKVFTRSHQKEVMKLSSQTLREYFESRLGPGNAEAAQRYYVELTMASMKDFRPFHGIEGLLQNLQAKGCHLALWTARDLQSTKEILHHTGLEFYFQAVVSGCCVGQSKPNPEGLQKIASHFGSQASDMVMVGDFDSDMLGAQAFGCKGLRVSWHPSVEEKKCEIAHHQFHQVGALLNWVEEQSWPAENEMHATKHMPSEWI